MFCCVGFLIIPEQMYLKVKIRGFRIELGEIDTHLGLRAFVSTSSQCLTHNVIKVNILMCEKIELLFFAMSKKKRKLFPTLYQRLVRRYIKSLTLIPLSIQVEDYSIQEIRLHLQSKLPKYSVPTGVCVSCA